MGPGEALLVEDGRRLSARSPLICASLAAAAASEAEPRVVDIDVAAAGSTPAAFRRAVEFALTDRPPSEAALWQVVWATGRPRPVARAAREGEAVAVEEALHTLDVLLAASLLGLSRLEQAAQLRLLGHEEPSSLFGEQECSLSELLGGGLAQPRREPPRGVLTEATVLPLLAGSFGRRRAVSKACLAFLAAPASAAEVLRGRERQLGVLYATHPVVGTLLSGVYKAARADAGVAATGSCRGDIGAASELPVDPRLVDLLLGPGACGGACAGWRAAAA